MPEYLYVLTFRGRNFGVHREPYVWANGVRSGGGFVLDDMDKGVEIGQVAGTCLPLLVEIDDQQHVVFGGEPDLREQRFAAINGQPYPVRPEGFWLSSPELFSSGMVVTMAGLDENRQELFRLTSPPLAPEELEPLFGLSWTGYAPSDS